MSKSTRKTQQNIGNGVSIKRFFTSTRKTKSFSGSNEFFARKITENLSACVEQKKSNEQKKSDHEKNEISEQKKIDQGNNEIIEQKTASEQNKSDHEKNKIIQVKVTQPECCETYKKELKRAKVLLKQSGEIILEKEIQIKNLQNQIQKNKKNILFIDFEDRFDSKDLKTIRSVKTGISNDSAFVRLTLAALYKNKEHILKNRSLVGRKHSGVKKDALTPEKKSIIYNMLR